MTHYEVPGIVLAQLGQMPTVETVTVHPPGPFEVLVRIVACGVCHTDLGAVTAARATPVILGHEGAGIVEALGAGVTHVQPGDHVVINWQAKCGRCRHCLAGRRDLCENIQGTAEPRIFWHDVPLQVMLNAGAFCSYVVVPAGGAVPIRRDMPMEQGSAARLRGGDRRRRRAAYGSDSARRRGGRYRRGRGRAQRRPGRTPGQCGQDHCS